MVTSQTRDEGCGLVTFVAEHPVDRREGALGCRAGEHHRAPCDAEGDSDGGFGRSVPADVTDHRPDGAVVEHDGVVEVATEESVGAGPVAGGGLKVRSVDVEHGKQAASEAIVLGPLSLGEEEADAVSLGPAALDGEVDGLGDAEAVDLALHEVVLGAGTQRGDASLTVVEAGQHDDRQVGRPVAEADDRLDALGVGEPEVDERAVVARGHLEGRADRRHAAKVEALSGVGQQLLDEERIAVIVLHQQEAEVGHSLAARVAIELHPAIHDRTDAPAHP